VDKLHCSYCGLDLDWGHAKGCIQEDAEIKRVSGIQSIPTGEVRVVDEKTGAEKGMKLARFSLIPPGFVWALAEHYGKGAKKYADRNWEKGYKWSLSVDATQRHFNQWLQGEDNDEETGSSHLVAAAWHLCALWFFHKFNKGTNDIRKG
jgi:hypothetical protein